MEVALFGIFITAYLESVSAPMAIGAISAARVAPIYLGGADSSGRAAAARMALRELSRRDTVEISAAAEVEFASRRIAAAEAAIAEEAVTNVEQTAVQSRDAIPADSTQGDNRAAREGNEATAADTPATDAELTEEERQVVNELRNRDREVRAHEQAHLAAAGPYARGGPSYTYQRGPDGRDYAIGGEVSIDTSEVPGDPEATIEKARVLRAAALAPAEPSAQDRAVAAAATRLETQARRELRQQQQEEREIADPQSDPGIDTFSRFDSAQSTPSFYLRSRPPLGLHVNSLA